jgi:signal peptidase I
MAELLSLARWTAGLLIVLFSGWGFIAIVGWVAYRWRIGLEFQVAVAIAAIISLGMFFLLEQRLWLSRFMNLRIHLRSSPAIEALFLWFLGVPGLLFRSTNVAEASSPQRSRTPHETSTTREIAETIVFVVVLVLLLKSFAAEAFVIPTGSMAETLYGYQIDVTCPQCGYEFPVNCSNEVDPSDGGPPIPVEACTCPNCRYHIDFPEERRRNPKFSRPSPSTGDRVLVAKFLYDLAQRHPNRLDVVVFKYPGDSNPAAFAPFPFSGPQKGYSAMNYIKRLIGKPGEIIAIWHGKLYVLPADLMPQGRLEELHRRSVEMAWENRIQQAAPEQKQELTERMQRGEEPEGFQKELWKFPFMFRDEMKDPFLSGGGFQIVRKPPDKILDMRRIVYDNDHPPEDLRGELRNRWASEAGNAWTSIEKNGFQATGGSETAWLRYRHILRPTSEAAFRGEKPELITDFMGYNTYQPHRGGGPPGQDWVGDLLVECEVNVEDPSGQLTLELSKGVDRFRAVWDLASGKCTLLHLKEPHTGESVPEDSRFTELQSEKTELHGKGRHRIRFANIDDRLVVWVDHDLPFGDGVNYEPLPVRGPYANDLQPASIGVRGGNLKIQHLSLWRDTYYTREPGREDALPDGGNWADPNQWEPLRTLSPVTLYVQPGHYLCLGDNSLESSDSRWWGLVPERLLLGRALLVYYPIGRAGRIK